MIWQILVFFLFISGLISALIAVYAWRHRETPGAKPFVFLVSAFAVWSVGEALIVLAHDLAMMLWLTKIQYLGIVTAPVFWFIFAIQYSGNSQWLDRRKRALLFVIPGLVLCAVWTTEYHPLYYKFYEVRTIDGINLLLNTPGAFYWVNLFYAYSLFAIGMTLVIRMFVSAPRQYSGQIGIIVVGALIPMLGNLIYNFNPARTLGIDLTPLFFTFTGVMLSWSLFRFEFLGITPIARDWVIENLKDGMLVLDVQNRIIDINPAMELFMDASGRKVIGKPVNRVFADRPDWVEIFLHETDICTELRSEDGEIPCSYELQISPIIDHQKLIKGKLIELRDISQHQRAVTELNRYVEENAQLLAEEFKQRQLAESLRQTMMILSSSLDRNAIVNEILAQLQKVLPYHSAALYLLDRNELRLEQVAGPGMITAKSYTTPRRHDQIQKIFQLKKAEVFMSAYSSHPEARGDPIYSSMAAPMVVGQEALGVLTIDRFEPMPFTQENAEILQAFTNQAAIAIKNTDNFQQAAAAAVLQERNRLAQDLHDAVNQTLFTASIMAEVLPKVWESDPDQGRQGLLEIRQLTRAALSEMRTLLMELHPQRITEKTLGDLLDHLTRSVSNRLRIPIELEIVNDTILPAEVQVTFYRVAQEAFNNITKHAAATHAWVIVDAQSGEASIAIRDNGQGFDPDKSQPGHLGLGIMEERAAKINADFRIKTQPNHGTLISLAWKDRKSSEL